MLYRLINFSFYVCVLSYLLCNCRSYAIDTPNEVILNKVLKSVKNRINQLENSYIRYRIEKIETRDWLTAAMGKKVDKPILSDRKTLFEAEIAFKGQKRRSYTKQLEPVPEANELASWQAENFIIYNGEISVRKSGRPNEFIISKKQTNNSVAEEPSNLIHETGFADALSCFLGHNKNPDNIDVKVTSDTERMTTITITFPKTKWTNVVKLDPMKDFAILSYEIYNGNGGRVQTASVVDQEEINGVTYPKTIVDNNYFCNSSAF